MRTLVILRGIPGIGKSTWLEQQGLRHFALSSDAIRLEKAAPVLTPDGRLAITQAHNAAVWAELRQRLEARMQNGEFTIIDAVHARGRDFSTYRDLVERYGYRAVCVDFGLPSMDFVLERNAQRPEHQRLPVAALENIHARIREGRVPAWVEVVSPENFREAVLDMPVLDLSHYAQICHIGDLQGCMAPIEGFIGDAPDPRTCYIFVGDYLDRGIQNGKVMRWVIDHLDAPNMYWLRGNHELHLQRWAYDLPAVSDEFVNRTLPQLLEAGITKDEVKRLLAKASDVLFYSYFDTYVMVSHAGLSTVPEEPVLLASVQYWKGTGNYTDPVDDQFTRNAPPEWYQVHGHRNRGLAPIVIPDGRSFNLEGGVEFGGQGRALWLDRQGFRGEEVTNRIFRPWTGPGRHDADTWKLPWLDAIRRGEKPVADPSLLKALEMHELVKAGTSESAPHVKSYNFTRHAFYQQAFDEVNSRARGLFVNATTDEVVCRGYEKFFNWGERKETQDAALEEGLNFPVRGFLKENGFLGLVGYDAVTDALFFASKRTPDSTFAHWLREIFEQTVSASDQEYLRRTLRDQQACLAFEVNDPINDPHIIPYGARHLVLLDVFRRSDKFERLPYPELEKFAARFGLRHKRLLLTFENWADMKAWRRHADQNDFTVDGRPIEGLVLEDRDGRMVKWKSPYYNYWKAARGAVERVIRIRATEEAICRIAGEEVGRQFIAWMDKLDPTLAAEKEGKWLMSAFKDDSGVELSAAKASHLRDEVLRLRNWKNGYAKLLRRVPELGDFIAWANALDDNLIAKGIVQLREMYLAQAQDMAPDEPVSSPEPA